VSRTYRQWKFRGAARCGVTGKASFKSTVAARSVVETREEWRGETARVYRCEWCDWYHLTSKRTNWEMARAAESRAA
jgi:hypothetical protein